MLISSYVPHFLFSSATFTFIFPIYYFPLSYFFSLCFQYVIKVQYPVSTVKICYSPHIFLILVLNESHWSGSPTGDKQGLVWSYIESNCNNLFQPPYVSAADWKSGSPTGLAFHSYSSILKLFSKPRRHTLEPDWGWPRVGFAFHGSAKIWFSQFGCTCKNRDVCKT